MPVIKVKQIEKREGKPIKKVLCDKFQQHGDSPRPQQVIADELGISQGTLSLWIKLAGLKRKQVLTPCEEES